MSDLSPEAARELYPIAVRQARAETIRDVVLFIILAGACAVLWSGGLRIACLIASVLGGVPVVVQNVKRYRRLKNLRPSEAAAAGEL